MQRPFPISFQMKRSEVHWRLPRMAVLLLLAPSCDNKSGDKADPATIDEGDTGTDGDIEADTDTDTDSDADTDADSDTDTATDTDTEPSYRVLTTAVAMVVAPAPGWTAPHDGFQEVDLDGDGCAEILASKGGGAEIFPCPLEEGGPGDTNDITADNSYGDMTYRNLAGGDWTDDGNTDLVRNDKEGIKLIYGPIPLDDLNSPDGPDPDLTLLEENHASSSGNNGYRTLTAIGDLDQDGYQDLAVGDHLYYSGSEDGRPEGSGVAYLLYGPITEDGTLVEEAGFTLRPTEPFDPYTYEGSSNLGSDIINVGDLTGDGFDEIVVTGEDMSDEDLGVVTWQAPGAYVVEGPPAGDILTGDVLASYLTIGLDVASAGDANGDGYQDLAIANSAHAPYEIGVYLAFGPMSGAHLTSELPDVLVDSRGSGIYVGECIAGPDDLDGDGVLDLLVGQPGTSPRGTAYVVPLSWEGSTEVSQQAVLQIVDQDESKVNRLGCDLLNISDRDGDGLSEILVGDSLRTLDTVTTYSGVTYLFLSSSWVGD